MTVREAADWLKLDPATIRQQIANGKLKATKHGRDWWLTVAEVARYQRENRRG